MGIGGINLMRNATATLLLLSVALPAGATEACAHRGDVSNAPENTIPALRSAVSNGAGMIEFDVQLSKDGHLVLMHDATVNRTTDGEGKVSDLLFAELRALDAGSWFAPSFAGTQIPTLVEALYAIDESVLCNVHLKNSPGVAEAAANVIRELGRIDQCFLACTVEQAREARAVVPEIRICNMSRQGSDRMAYVDLTIAERCEYIQLHKRNGLDGIQEAVGVLHAAGVKVNYFGAEDPEVIRALRDAGVDYILTDTLETCVRALNEPRQESQK